MLTKEEFAKFILGLARAVPRFAPDFSDDATIATWYHAFREYDVEGLKRAFVAVRDRFSTFPSIAEIKSILDGNAGLSDAQVGQDLAARIEHCVTRYGRYQASRAEKYLGPVGAELVRQLGGWESVCDIQSMSEMGSKRKQWREMGELLSQKARAGLIDVAPQLPPGNVERTRLEAPAEKPPEKKADIDYGDLLKAAGIKDLSE